MRDDAADIAERRGKDFEATPANGRNKEHVMPDEPEKTTTDEPEETGSGATTTVEPEPEVRAEPERKHPLEEGGVRFNEVYGRMKAAEARSTLLEQQLAAKAAEPVKPAVQQPQFYSADQLQTAVDQGKITGAQMAAQLAWQAKEEAKREIKQELTGDSRRQSALAEVNQYVEKLPALNDHTSPEFQRVSRAAYEIAEDMGRSVGDPVVQRMALRQELGTLAKLVKVDAARDFDRRNADVATETGGGGGRTAPSKDPLKDVPRGLKEHWDRLGYTKEQRLAEVPYINTKRWAGR